MQLFVEHFLVPFSCCCQKTVFQACSAGKCSVLPGYIEILRIPERGKKWYFQINLIFASKHVLLITAKEGFVCASEQCRIFLRRNNWDEKWSYCKFNSADLKSACEKNPKWANSKLDY